MGDCNIRVMISKKALKASGTLLALNNIDDITEQNFYTYSKKWDADATVRTVIEGAIVLDVNGFEVHVTPLSLLEEHLCRLWDCTQHPPVDITDWPLTIFCERSGFSKSRTLFEARWWPSATLQILAKNEQYQVSKDIGNDNLHSIKEPMSTSTTSRVKLTQQYENGHQIGDKGLPLPSQVLASVTKRFFDDADIIDETIQARATRQQNKLIASKKEELRIKRLYDKIQSVRACSKKALKNKNVSNQVQRMLIKSSAVGRKELRQEDRIYFRCLIVLDCDDEDNKGNFEDPKEFDREQYRFYSMQDSVARILESFESQKLALCNAQYESELLVKNRQSAENKNDKDVESYGRISVLLRVYEAIAQGLLQNFDEVMIRFFNPEVLPRTTEITQRNDHQREQSFEFTENTMTDTPMENNIDQDTASNAVGEKTTENESSSFDDSTTIERLRNIIEMMDEKNLKTKRSKRQSASVQKVREMQMKSKAKGDTKRVQMTDRFFFDLVILIDNNTDDGTCLSTAECCFLSKSDRISRIVQDFSTKKATSLQWEIYSVKLRLDTADNDPSFMYQKINDTSITFREAEKQSHLNPFDRIIIRYY